MYLHSINSRAVSKPLYTNGVKQDLVISAYSQTVALRNVLRKKLRPKKVSGTLFARTWNTCPVTKPARRFVANGARTRPAYPVRPDGYLLCSMWLSSADFPAKKFQAGLAQRFIHAMACISYRTRLLNYDRKKIDIGRTATNFTIRLRRGFGDPVAAAANQKKEAANLLWHQPAVHGSNLAAGVKMKSNSPSRTP